MHAPRFYTFRVSSLQAQFRLTPPPSVHSHPYMRQTVHYHHLISALHGLRSILVGVPNRLLSTGAKASMGVSGCKA
jgi:hypothetical protein